MYLGLVIYRPNNNEIKLSKVVKKNAGDTKGTGITTPIGKTTLILFPYKEKNALKSSFQKNS